MRWRINFDDHEFPPATSLQKPPGDGLVAITRSVLRQEAQGETKRVLVLQNDGPRLELEVLAILHIEVEILVVPQHPRKPGVE